MVNLAAMKKSKDAKGHHRGSACHCASEAVYLKAQKHHHQSMAAAVAPGATVTFESVSPTTAPPVSRAPISRGETFDSTTSSVGCRSDFNELHVSRNVLTPIPPLSSATQSPIPSAPTSPPPPAEAMFRLNIGGKSYRIREEVVLSCRTPSLLSALINATHEQRLIVVDGYNPLTGEYYMERNVRVADHVLDYFVTGLLHKPNDVCNERFREELDFWKLRHDQIAPCCSVLNEFPKLKVQEETEREFDGVICADFRYAIWQMTEDPSSSLFSKIFSFVSIGFIFASVCGLILGSMPEFQSDSSMAHHYHLMYNHRLSKMSANNSTMTTKYIPDKAASKTNASEPAFVYKPTDMPMDALVILEYICIGWFSFEYLARFLVAPRKSKFVISTMNLIDLFTIIPFFVELALDSWGLSANRVEVASSDGTTSISRRTQSWIGAMLVIRVLRVLRMARVFKLARYSQGLQIFGNTLRSSMTELSMLSMFLVTGTVFFSTVMYFLEKDEPNTDFYSIPAACWWCITTVTTVGYGDTFPITTAGKSVATAASICGIIILAFPISMIVEKFATAQQQALVEDQMKQAQMSAVANDYLLKRFPTRRKACKEPMLSPNK
uniref:BTB domain-containing protein n=1 Tax=Panagrellus redivivus TaxID=6233 RepID=A0A7E4VMJ1_PANRE